MRYTTFGALNKLRAGLAMIGFIALAQISMGYDHKPDFQSPYPNVDLDGRIFDSIILDDLQCGDGTQMPVQLKFSSAPGARSPYLGSGWQISLLEARAVLVDDGLLKVSTPAGGSTTLVRDKNDPTSYRSLDGLWKGTTSEDRLVVVGPDAAEITFEKGKISSLKTRAGTVLTWIRSGNKVTGIQSSRGALLISLEEAAGDGLPKALVVNGTKYDLSFGEKPIIEEQQSQRVISRVDQSLTQITGPSGAIANYSYSVTPELRPVVEKGTDLPSKQLLSWDPLTGHIVKDSDWSYIVKTTPGTVGIARQNVDGKKEDASYDFNKAVFQLREASGDLWTTTFFTSAGALHGKVRSVDKTTNGINQRIQKADYDERGRLARLRIMGGTYEYAYNPDNTMASFQKEALWSGDSEKMPQNVRNVIALCEKWSAEHPNVIAESRSNSAFLDVTSTYLITPNDKRAVYNYLAPLKYKTVVFSDVKGNPLQFFPESKSLISAPASMTGLSPEATIWNWSKLKEGLRSKIYSLGVREEADGYALTLVMNQTQPFNVAPLTATYKLGKDGQLLSSSMTNGMGFRFGEDVRYVSFDGPEVEKLIEAWRVPEIPTRLLPWGNAIQLEVAKTKSSSAQN